MKKEFLLTLILLVTSFVALRSQSGVVIRQTQSSDNQTVDTLSLTGTVLTLTLEDDNEAPYTVDLASLAGGGGTDDQTVDTLSLTGTVLTLTLEGDNEAPYTVDLASLQDGTGTDDQNITFDDTNRILAIEGGNSQDLSEGIQEEVNALLVGGTNVTLTYNDGANTLTIDAVGDGTGTDDQQIETFTLVGNTLTLAIESDGQPDQTLDFSGYLDNTDSQSLTFSDVTRILSISGGNSVDLSEGIQDAVDDLLVAGTNITLTYNDGANTLTIDAVGDGTGTDDQNITFDAANRILAIEGGNSQDLSEGIQEEVNALLVAGTNITLTYNDGANTLTIDAAGGGTDDQTLTFTDATRVLAIESGNSVDLSEGIQDEVDALLVGGENIALTYNDAGNTLTIDGTDDGILWNSSLNGWGIFTEIDFLTLNITQSLTLYTVASGNIDDGEVRVFVNESTSGTITVNAPVGYTIDGSASASVAPGESLWLMVDETNTRYRTVNWPLDAGGGGGGSPLGVADQTLTAARLIDHDGNVLTFDMTDVAHYDTNPLVITNAQGLNFGVYIDDTGFINWQGNRYYASDYTNIINKSFSGNDLITVGNSEDSVRVDGDIFVLGSPDFIAAEMPDNLVLGGNARGTKAVDWQISRLVNSEVASGEYSVLTGGKENTAAGDYSGVAYGLTSKATADYSGARGYYAESKLYGASTQASGRFSALGDAQTSVVTVRRELTGTGNVDLFLDGSTLGLDMTSTNEAWTAHVNLVAVVDVVGNGTAALGEVYGLGRFVTIKRIGASTTVVGQTLVHKAIDTNMADAAIVFSADNTNEALRINFAAPSSSGTTTVIRIVARVEISQIVF
jgi:hypothetical protein